MSFDAAAGNEEEASASDMMVREKQVLLIRQDTNTANTTQLRTKSVTIMDAWEPEEMGKRDVDEKSDECQKK